MVPGIGGGGVKGDPAPLGHGPDVVMVSGHSLWCLLCPSCLLCFSCWSGFVPASSSPLGCGPASLPTRGLGFRMQDSRVSVSLLLVFNDT